MNTAQPIHGPVRPLDAESIVELVHRAVVAEPDRVALVSGRGEWTFERLWRRSTAIAGALLESGVVPGDRVALWGNRTPDTIATALAVMAIGAAYVPLDPVYPAGRVQAVIAGADPVVLAYDGAAAGNGPSVRHRSELDVAQVPEGGPSLPLTTFPTGGDVAYVMFTSGSTGTPKGVVVEHRSLLNYVAWCAATVGRRGPGNTLLGSLGFDHSITSLWPSLCQGKRVLLSGGVWDHAANFGSRAEPETFLKLTPSHLRFFERTGSPRYTGLVRLLMLGGESLDRGLVTALGSRVAGVRLMNHYGPTETTVGCCFYEFDSGRVPALPTVPIGLPIWNTRAYLVDDDLAPVPPGTPAELVIAGHGVARGYLGDHPGGDRFIDEADVGGPSGRAYRTGDRVEQLADGTLLHLGRFDDQIKVNGYRVEPGELRGHALAVPGVTDVAFDVRSVDGIEIFVVGPGGDELATAVRTALEAVVPPAVVPRRVHVVPELVFDAHGKCDVRATRRLVDAVRR